MTWLKELGELGALVSFCIVALIVFIIIGVIFYIIELESKYYKQIFTEQIDQLGKFIQDKEIVKFGDILKGDHWYYEAGVRYSINIPVTVKKTETTETKTFKLYKVTVIPRENEKLAIEIKTSQNPSNEPIVNIYVPDAKYMVKIWHKQKIEEKKKFITENYSTEFTSKGV